jgi:tetratricopeptide (TPR) repeat protein
MDEHRRRHEMPEAEATAAEAVARFPDSVDISIAYGRILLLTYRAEEAAQVFLRAEQLAPQNDRPAAWRVAALSRQRLFDEAIAAGIKATQRLPNSSLVRVALGRVFLDSSRPEQALEHFARAATTAPHDIRAINWHAAGLAELHRWPEAQTVIRKAIERDPAETKLYFQLGWILIDDCSREAIEYFDIVLNRAPQHPQALEWRSTALRNLRRFSEAEEATAGAIRLLPRCPRLYVEHAWVSSDQDREDEAVTRVDGALAIDPRHSWALRSRMNFLQWARRFEEAEQAAAEAIERRPDDPDIHTAAAWVASDQDHYDEATARVDRALAIDPRHSWALRSRISILQAAPRFEEAEQAAAEAIERRPDDPDIHTAAAWFSSDRDREDEAVTRMDRALAIDPRHSWALRNRIYILRAARRFEEAEQAAAEAIERRPDDPEIHTAAAWVASDQDHYDEAAARVDRALAIDPRHSWALRSRISILQAARRFEEAEQAAAEAIELSPKDSGIRVELGRMKDYRREFEPALLCLAIVLARDPDHVEANVAKSAVLRSMRRCAEARREITRLSKLKPEVRELKFELGQIHHDERRLVEARKVFRDLLATAANADEHAEAHHSLGWVAFTETDFITAEQEFRAAIEQQPGDLDYELALAWALTRQGGRRREEEAEQIATKVVERRPDPSAHVCLGVLAFKRGGLAASEYHLNQALQIDPWHGSHTDLGALYSHIGRYDDAESELRQAVTRDWYDTVAHVELGRLFLQLGEQRLPDAEREFRQALACDPTSSSAAIGLAQALEKAGDEIAAESTLRQALRRQEAGDTWRTFLALARLLVQRGDKQQNSDLLADAYAQAQRAIGLAPDAEADPHFVAGVALHRLGSLSVTAVVDRDLDCVVAGHGYHAEQRVVLA